MQSHDASHTPALQLSEESAAGLPTLTRPCSRNCGNQVTEVAIVRKIRIGHKLGS